MLTPRLCATLLGATPDAPAEPGPRPADGPVAVSPTRARAPLMAGIGATLALSGTVIWLVGNVRQGTVASQPLSPAELEVERWRLQQTQLGGAALGLLGACAIGISAVMWSWDAAPVAVAPLLVPQGGGVALAGRFP